MGKKKNKSKKIVKELPDTGINKFQEMPNPKLIKKFNLNLISTINYIIYSMFFILSLLYIDGLSFPSEEPRWWVFTTAAALLPLLASIYIFVKKTDVTIEITWFHIIFAGIFFWISLTLIWSIDRAEMVNDYIYYVSSMILAAFLTLYAGKLNISVIFRLFPITISTVSIIGILQYFGIDGNIFPQVAAPASTFVNKNVATPLVVLLLPSVYYMILFVDSKKWARIYTVCFSISLTYLVVAATRSSWVGTFFSLILTITGMFVFRKVLRTFKGAFIKRRFVYLLFGVFLTVLTIFIHDAGHFPDVGVSRLTQLDTLVGDGLTEGSGKQRLMFWQNTFAMIADNPLNGVGLGSFASAYPLYHNSMVNDTGYSSDLYLKYAHNDPLQCLAELGFPGFMLVLIFFIIVFYQLITLLLDDSGKNLPNYLGFATGITGLLIDSLFNFPFQFSTYMFFIILMTGVIHFKYNEKFDHKFRVYSFNLNYKIIAASIAPIFLILFMISIYIAYYRYLGGLYDQRARIYESQRNYNSAIAYTEASVRMWPYKYSYLSNAAIISYRYATIHGSTENYQSALRHVNNALQSSPYNYKQNLLLFKIALQEKNPIILSQVKKIIPVFIRVSPDDKIYQSYEIAADIYYYSNDIENSIKYYEKVLEKYPGRKDIIERVKKLK